MRQVQCDRLRDGRVRIHYFARDAAGPVRTAARAGAVEPVPLVLGGAVGFIACQPKAADARPSRGPGGVIVMGLGSHTDDPRAATCPECCATQAYSEAMAVFSPDEPAAFAEKPKNVREYLERAAAHGDAAAAELLKDYDAEHAGKG